MCIFLTPKNVAAQFNRPEKRWRDGRERNICLATHSLWTKLHTKTTISSFPLEKKKKSVRIEAIFHIPRLE